MRIVKSLFCFFLFLSLFHSYGFSQPYAKLLRKIHKHVDIEDIPTKTSSDAIHLRFKSPFTEIYLAPAVIKNYNELSEITEYENIKSLHPLAPLFYISILQGNEIDFDVDDITGFKNDVQVKIIVDIWRFTKIIQLTHNNTIERINKAIFNYLHSQLNKRQITIRELRDIFDREEISQEAWADLFPYLEEHVYTVQDETIESHARHVLRTINEKKTELEDRLLNKVAKERNLKPKLVYEKTNDEEYIKVWNKACEINTKEKTTTFKISVNTVSRSTDDCDQCCRCCASCSCCFFCWPCYLLQSLFQCCCSPTEQYDTFDACYKDTELIIESRQKQ